jgi:hypothetical protein
MNFAPRLPAVFVAGSFRQLERLDITKKEPPDFVCLA